MSESGTGNARTVTVSDLFSASDPAHPARFMRLEVLANAVTERAAIEDWRQAMFGSSTDSGDAADSADPNNNGIVNLLEFALGGDPAGATTGLGVLPQSGRGPGDTLRITFNRHLDRNDLILTVQSADSPAGPWTNLVRSTAGSAFTILAPGATVIESGTGNARAVIVTDLHPATDPAHPTRFMRLEVTR